MSRSLRVVEYLIKQGLLSPSSADAAANHVGIYPNKQVWLAFFDKALLVIGAVALALSLVFFVAYNWQNLGKMGKFALVEGALVITIASYVGLSIKTQLRRRFGLIRQLLLFVASVITGSLLALFGQVYQTGADTWQLFFAWALLITPWVIIARFSALWLLWLGLVNACLLLYFNVADLPLIILGSSQTVFQVAILALVNLTALYGWLIVFEHKRALLSRDFSDTPTHNNDTAHSVIPAQMTLGLHWSTYAVGFVSTFFITYLGFIPVFDDLPIVTTLISLALWMGWCGLMLCQFYKRRIDGLMLTYLSGSVITVVMFWASEWLFDLHGKASYLFLGFLLIGMSSAAVVWLRKVARLSNENNIPNAEVKGSTKGRNDE